MNLNFLRPNRSSVAGSAGNGSGEAFLTAVMARRSNMSLPLGLSMVTLITSPPGMVCTNNTHSNPLGKPVLLKLPVTL